MEKGSIPCSALGRACVCSPVPLCAQGRWRFPRRQTWSASLWGQESSWTAEGAVELTDLAFVGVTCSGARVFQRQPGSISKSRSQKDTRTRQGSFPGKERRPRAQQGPRPWPEVLREGRGLLCVGRAPGSVIMPHDGPSQLMSSCWLPMGKRERGRREVDEESGCQDE